MATREEIVLRKNHIALVEKLDAYKLIDLLIENGILKPHEVREVISAANHEVTVLMSFLLERCPGAFPKFMEALRMAGYGDLAVDLERELENTRAPASETTQEAPTATGPNGNRMATLVRHCSDDTNAGGGANGILGQMAVAATNSLINSGLQRFGLGAATPVVGLTLQYRRAQMGDDVVSTWNINSAVNITPDLLMGLMMKH